MITTMMAFATALEACSITEIKNFVSHRQFSIPCGTCKSYGILLWLALDFPFTYLVISIIPDIFLQGDNFVVYTFIVPE